MRLVQANSFKKDAKKQKKRGKDLSKLKAVVDLLVAGEALPDQFVDHPLAGNGLGWRDCHIEPDWILIYKVTPYVLTLARTGSHADLF